MCMQIPTDPDMCYRLWCQFSRYKQNLQFHDDIIHHDDDPGTAADDEDDGNHDQNYG